MSDDLKLADYDHPMSLVTWQSWVDELPLPPEFEPAQNALQEYLWTQAAELTRLRARCDAADKLAEAGSAMIDFHNGPAEAKRPDTWQRLLQRFAAALSAYEGEKE